MTEEEFSLICTPKPIHTSLRVSDVIRDVRPDRTLLYGYDMSRKTIHLYVKGGVVWLRKYNIAGENMQIWKNPSIDQCLEGQKRFYPECCDFGFAAALRTARKLVSYTIWQEREKKTYYGMV